MVIDSRFGNSSGYFKDPLTEEDLSPETPRVIPCEIKNGKFIWPRVLCSDGSQLLKIVYKLFTDEEKNLYKTFYNRGGSPSGSVKEKPVKVEPVHEIPVEEPEEHKVIKYDAGSAMCPETLAHIKECNEYLGTANIGGLYYSLLGMCGSNKIYYVPRAMIPEEEFRRLCDGTAV